MLNKSLKALLRTLLPKPAVVWARGRQRKVISFYKQVTMTQQDFQNREGLQNFSFRLREGSEIDGVSAMLRIKNEQAKIYYVLRSIFEVFDEIVIVDNGSTDGTLEIVREFKQQRDQDDKIKLYFYPFQIARCGQEHFDTPENSIHSLAYYYNWALSRCSRRYVCKWDGDMILRKEARQSLKEVFSKIQIHEKKCWGMYGQTVYRDLVGNFYLSDEINWEPRIFPYGLNPRFHKADLFETLVAAPPLPTEDVPGVSFYELKFADENEFSHLSTTDFPTERKQKEIKYFECIKRGDAVGLGLQKLPATFIDDEIGDGSGQTEAVPYRPRLLVEETGI